MKGSWIRYSAEELAWLEANKTLVLPQYFAEFQERFSRNDVQPGNLQSLRKRKGWRTGRTGQFEKGVRPANKGKPCAPGKGGNHPNARARHFSKGVRRGVAERLHQPIGYERIREDGYLWRKVNDDKPAYLRWKQVHRINWEALHGPVPEGMALKCLGHRLDTSPANWELVPRGLLPRLNGRHGRGYDAAPAELKPTIMAVTKLEHQLGKVSTSRKKTLERNA